jgi:hypothetical protein
MNTEHCVSKLGLAGFCLLAIFCLTNSTQAQSEGGSPPHIVSTSPATGKSDVDPGTKEITVTFDQDMDRGFSWTGGGPNYPTIEPGKKPHWRDKRTCVLSVKLEPGHYYRVGINSLSYHGFSGVSGVAVTPTAITFRTSGTPLPKKTPKIVSLNPPNGAKDVSASLTEVRVTFNVKMGGGMSWCGGGPNFPDSPAGKDAYWTDDGKTCVLPVQLKPGWSYEMSINCPSFQNFKSEQGVSLSPVSYSFSTGQ